MDLGAYEQASAPLEGRDRYATYHSMLGRGAAFTAKRASVAVLREGPRLIALGKPAADAVTQAGHKLGLKSKSDLFGAVGVGAGEDLMVADTIAKTLLPDRPDRRGRDLNAVRIRKHFTEALVALSAYFADKV